MTCGEGKQDRSVFCVDGLDVKKTVDLKLCNESFKPDIVRPCVLRACPAWTVGAWSKVISHNVPYLLLNKSSNSQYILTKYRTLINAIINV